MDNELFELCREVYKRAGWQVGLNVIRNDGAIFDELEDHYLVDGKDFVPLYTSDYLLEKLPKFIDDRRLTLQPVDSGSKWCASYDDVDEVQDSRLDSFGVTPLEALIELTIALDDAKELTK